MPDAAAVPGTAPLPRLVDLLLRWRIEGLGLPVGQALAQVARHLEQPSRAHHVEWQTLRSLLGQVLAVTLRTPEVTGEPAGERYWMLSRACAAGVELPAEVTDDPGETARDACVLLHQGHYVSAAQALTVLAGSRESQEDRVLRRFTEQARDHLSALASAFCASGLAWELQVLAHVRGQRRRASTLVAS